jgi:AcrR family transcriptional regulator
MARRDDVQQVAILDAARSLLAAEGPAALTVRRIADAAGCSTMGVYSGFGGKDGIVDELYLEGFERLCDAMSARERSDDPVDDLRSCARTYRETALAQRTHYLIMFARAVPGWQPTDDSRAFALKGFEELVARFERAIAAGALAGDAVGNAEVFWGAIHGLVMLELDGICPSSTTPEARFARAVDVLLAGMAVR